jgi:hypothetical protein
MPCQELQQDDLTGLSPVRPIWLQTMPGAALLSAARSN